MLFVVRVRSDYQAAFLHFAHSDGSTFQPLAEPISRNYLVVSGIGLLSPAIAVALGAKLQTITSPSSVISIALLNIGIQQAGYNARQGKTMMETRLTRTADNHIIA